VVRGARGEWLVVRGARGEWLVVRGARGEWLVVRGARGEWLVAGGPMACNAAVGNVVLSGGNNTAMLKDTRIWTSG
jgi:hypothetical protein